MARTSAHAPTGARRVQCPARVRVGRTIDLVGGRGVLAASNLIFATGLCLLAMAHGPVMLTLGWIVMGAGMGVGQPGY